MRSSKLSTYVMILICQITAIYFRNISHFFQSPGTLQEPRHSPWTLYQIHESPHNAGFVVSLPVD